MTTNHTRTRGFSLVEVLISFTMLGLILSAVGITVLRSKSTYDQGMTIGTLESQARRTLDQIAGEFEGAIWGTLTPDASLGVTGTSSCDFRTCTGFAGGSMLWTPCRVQLQPDPSDANDGVDNNSNGLIDECQVVLTRNVGLADQKTVVLSGYVREYLEGETFNVADDNGNGLQDERGLSFRVDNVGDETLSIRLTLEALDSERRVITRSVETAIHVRN